MSYSRAVLILLFLCLVPRLFLFTLVKPWEPTVRDRVILNSDALGYHRLAVSIQEDRRFSFQKGGSPDTLRTPLYPVLISLIYSIWGCESTWRVLLVQILIDTASCILLCLLVLKFFNLRVAFYAALFYALDPFLILYSLTLLSDGLFVFLCLLAAYWFSEAIHSHYDHSSLYVLLSAFFLGLATLVRPVSQYLPFVLVPFLFFVLRKEIKKACTLASLFLMVLAITLSPWLIRNYSTFGVLSLSTVGPYNLIVLYVGPMEMERRGQTFEEVQGAMMQEVDHLMRQEGRTPEKLSAFQQAAYWQKLAFHYIRQHPVAFAKHYLLGIFHSFANLGTGPYGDLLQLPKKEGKFEIKAHSDIVALFNDWLKHKTHQEIAIGLVVGLYLGITYSLLVVGLVISWRKDRENPFLWFNLILILYFILITGTAGLARFKLPAIPYYLVFTGLGLAYVFRGKERFTGKEEV
jgi:4-amino-4-deoxy-L-arabinose transferase-like glycosyltransferase